MKTVILMLTTLVTSFASAQYDGGYGPIVVPVPALSCSQSTGYGDAVYQQTFIFDFAGNKVLEVNSGRTFALTSSKNLHSGFAYTVSFIYSVHWLLEFDINFWPGNYAREDIIEVRSDSFPGLKCSVVK